MYGGCRSEEQWIEGGKIRMRSMAVLKGFREGDDLTSDG